MITFNHDDLSEVLAYIVENDVLLASVEKELKQIQNVTVINEARIKSYGLPDEKQEITRVELENGTSFSCKLLVSF